MTAGRSIRASARARLPPRAFCLPRRLKKYEALRTSLMNRDDAARRGWPPKRLNSPPECRDVMLDRPLIDPDRAETALRGRRMPARSLRNLRQAGPRHHLGVPLRNPPGGSARHRWNAARHPPSVLVIGGAPLFRRSTRKSLRWWIGGRTKSTPPSSVAGIWSQFYRTRNDQPMDRIAPPNYLKGRAGVSAAGVRPTARRDWP
jgi:hypothetical protein